MTTKVALSLSGSGHLLVYQLGAARVLLKGALNVQHVVGSSGGAIVATLVAHGIDLDDYANDFITTRGHGMKLLRERLQESSTTLEAGPSLSICTTRCSTGELHLFDFENDTTSELLLPALEASCKIPTSFHPWDIMSSARSYGDSEGVLVGGDYHVDGGIAAPAPPTPPGLTRILISPIVGNSTQSVRISPSTSLKTWWPSLQLSHGFGAQASFANLRALRAAAGMTTSSELQDWYQRGQDDAQKCLEKEFGE